MGPGGGESEGVAGKKGAGVEAKTKTGRRRTVHALRE